MFIYYSDSYNCTRALNLSMIESFAIVPDGGTTTSYKLIAYTPSYTADCDRYILLETNKRKSADHVLSVILLAYAQGRPICNITEYL